MQVQVLNQLRKNNPTFSFSLVGEKQIEATSAFGSINHNTVVDGKHYWLVMNHKDTKALNIQGRAVYDIHRLLWEEDHVLQITLKKEGFLDDNFYLSSYKGTTSDEIRIAETEAFIRCKFNFRGETFQPVVFRDQGAVCFSIAPR